MGLVDYSESDASASESEAPVKPTTKAPPKKPAFQKVVDRSNPGKIIVNLPQATSSSAPSASHSDGPPAKRARTGGAGGLFAGFNAFLPPPKNTGKQAPKKPTAGQTRPGVNLKTSAEPGFSRDAESSGNAGAAETALGGMNLPPPKRPAEPSISDELKPAEEVKLVGKPLMFRPLSVARNTTKKKTTKSGIAMAPAVSTASTQSSGQATNTTAKEDPAPAPPPKKTSLFSLHVEEPSISATSSAAAGGAYEPLFETGESADQYPADTLGDYSQHANYGQAVGAGTESLDSIANDLNLSAAERRELFGRGGSHQTAKKVINFNMDQEYKHNEELRAAGEQQTHNPVRAIQGGKHSLRQLVQNVANQRDALEESFAKGKSNRREAANKYGW